MRFRTKNDIPWAEVALTSLNRRTGEWRYQRPVTKVEKCHRCGLCDLFCPTGCIRERRTYFAADLDYCKGCGICASVCPIKAISMVRERGIA